VSFEGLLRSQERWPAVAAGAARTRRRLASGTRSGGWATLPLIPPRPAAVQFHRFVDLIGKGFDAGIRVGFLSDSSLIARRIAPLGGMRVAGDDNCCGQQAT
jgi:hypothetical protein